MTKRKETFPLSPVPPTFSSPRLLSNVAEKLGKVGIRPKKKGNVYIKYEKTLC